MQMVLASQSPRRRELLILTGYEFQIHPIDIDEIRQPDEHPADYVLRLSREKAQAAATAYIKDTLIVAADTIVLDGYDVLEKPANATEAATMLKRLRGRTHHVITAVTLYHVRQEKLVSDACRSPVLMRGYTDSEIDAYIASGDPFDKAGAYAIQNEAFRPALVFAHCFANVMGLPLCHINRLLWRFGLTPPVDIPWHCQTGIDYRCPVYKNFLSD